MFKKLLLTGALVSSLVSVYASTPTFTASPSGDGNNVTVSVTGDASTPIVLYYFSTLNSTTQSTTIGSTDSNGSFSGTVSTSASGIGASVPVYVMLNGYQSASLTWPYGVSTTASTTLSLSQSSLSLSLSQTANITITGSGSYYISNNTNSGVATAVISGGSITVTAVNAGASTITVCQASTQCVDVSVTVSFTVTNTPISTPVVFGPIISVGQTMSFNISGNSAPYTILSATNGIFSALISGNILTISGLSVGSSSVNVCSSNSSCTTLSITVNPAIVNSVVQTVTSPASSSNKYKFNNPLKYGVSGDEVIELQKRLKEEGFFSGTFSSHYGDATIAAIKKYQSAHGLSPLGNLGPATRAELNK